MMSSQTKLYDVITMAMLIEFQKKGKVSVKYIEEQKKALEQIKKNKPTKVEEAVEYDLIYIKM